MWRLKIAEGEGAWLKSKNNHIGRRLWELDPDLGTPKERATVNKARSDFFQNRFSKKQSSDLLMRMQELLFQEDLYYPHPLIQDIFWEFMHKVAEPLFTGWPLSKLRERALQKILQHIHYEDENSEYLCIGVIEKVLCLLSCWVENRNSDAIKFHLARLPDHLWISEDGMKVQACGSQLWDTAFAVQAIMSSNLIEEYGSTLTKAHRFLKNSQVMENPMGDYSHWYRHVSKGGWTFLVADQRWVVSDCTAEALTAVLLVSEVEPKIVGEAMEIERLYDAVNIILSLQNSNGGFSTWGLTRTYSWMELFNPSEMFADIIIDYQHVECTSSAVHALALFRKLYPGHRKKEIENCIAKATMFIQDVQESNGSWSASLPVSYTYATWFGIRGLIAAGKTYNNSPAIQKACEFLLSKQQDSGG
ncbi:Cycloartenol synthase [Acorus gramineus]|uniref:Cycloartenol synthase n=1 Tax=Acorus gramineus TaxID=55184 RepID=A0AAV9AZR1_ACOGR|nr:Cycloartenol synthase [Acorus gramineus]